MNRKYIESLQKDNITLSNQLEEIKKKVQETNLDNIRLLFLISEVEEIRSQFLIAIKDLEKAKDKYNSLNKDLMGIKQNIKYYHIPLYSKILNKYKKIKRK